MAKRLEYEDIKEFIENISKSGCILVTTINEYNEDIKNLNKDKFKIKCKCGKIFKTRFTNFKHSDKRQCNDCGLKIKGEKRKLTYEYVKNYIEVESKSEDKLLSEEYEGSQKKLSIQCKKGHVYNSSWNNYKHMNCRCPKCKESSGEQKISNFLNINNIKYIFQHRFSDCKYKNTLPFDFYIPGLNACIEFDGEQHCNPDRTFGNREDFESQKLRDNIKNEYCQKNNIPLLRIPNRDFNNIENILAEWLQIQGKNNNINVNINEKSTKNKTVTFQNGNKYQLNLFYNQEKRKELVDKILNNPENKACVEQYWESNKTKTILDILSNYLYNGDGTKNKRDEHEYPVLSYRQIQARNGEIEIPVGSLDDEIIKNILLIHKKKGKKNVKKYKNSSIHKLTTLRIPIEKRVNQKIYNESNIRKHIWEILDDKIIYYCEKGVDINIDCFTEQDQTLPYIFPHVSGEWATVYDDLTFTFDGVQRQIKGIYEFDKILCYKLDNKILFFNPEIEQVKDFSKKI